MASTPTPSKNKNDVDPNWKLNNIETKVRINEQNIINDRRHVHLMSRNLLSIKKEVHEKLDTLLHGSNDVTTTIAKLEKRVSALEKLSKKLVHKKDIIALQRFHENFNYFDKEMTKEEADRILDGIVRKYEHASKIDENGKKSPKQ